MTHTITFTNATIIPGEWNLVDQPDGTQEISLTNPTEPANATEISLNHDFGELTWAIKVIAHCGRGFGGFGIGGGRNFNPDANGIAQPLPRAAYLRFSSMGGNTFQVRTASHSAINTVWHDWKFDTAGQELHPLFGQPIRSPIQPGDWIELDAITGDGYIDDDGIPRILVVPGKTFLVLDVNYSTGAITVLEPNVPARTEAAWAVDHGILDGWLWRFPEECSDCDLGAIPIFKTAASGDHGAYVDPDVDPYTLNIETRVCAHDRFVFAALWDARDFDGLTGLGWVGDHLYFSSEGYREAKTCVAVDVLNRLDRGDGDGQSQPSPTAPWAIYPTHRRAQECRLGLEGSLVHMCDGGASVNGGVPLCDRFTARSAPSSFGTTVANRFKHLLNGLEIVGRQDIVGFPWISYFYASPPSLAGMFGHWWPTAGGPDMNPVIILGIIGGTFGLVDQRADSGAPIHGLWGFFGSALRRPLNVFDSNALAISSCARFLGHSTERQLPRDGADLTAKHLDVRCDVTDGVNMEGYSPVGLFSHESNYRRQLIDHRAFFTETKLVHVRDLDAGERNIQLPSSWIPTHFARDEGSLLSATIASVSGDEIQFTATPTTPFASQVLGHFTEWFKTAVHGSHPTVWHNSVKRKVQPRDVMQFASGHAPAGLSGVSWVVATTEKNTSTEIDKLTLFANSSTSPGSIITPSASWIGKTVMFYTGRALWEPSTNDVEVKQRDAGSSDSFAIIAATDYDVRPGGQDDDHDGSPEWHVRLDDAFGGDKEIMVVLNQALLPVNLTRADHLTEARTLIENATTMLIIPGGDALDLAFIAYWFWQRGGANDPNYGWWTQPPHNGTVPSWGPTTFGPQVRVGPSGNKNGVSWEIGVPVGDPTPYPYGPVQSKSCHVDVLTIPDNIHVSSADSIISAKIWVKATPEPGSPSGLTIEARLVKRRKDLSDVWCANHLFDSGGSCVGMMGTTALKNPHTSVHGDKFSPNVYPQPTDGNYSWTTTGLEGIDLGFVTDLYGQSVNPGMYTEDFCFSHGRKPYMVVRDTPGGGPPYGEMERVHCNQVNHDSGALVCVHQSGGTEFDYYVSTRWGGLLGDSASVSADGSWHELDITDAVKAALAIGADHDIGIAIGVAEAVDMSFGGGASFADVTTEPGPTHPDGDPGGSDPTDLIVHWEIPSQTTYNGYGVAAFQAFVSLSWSAIRVVFSEEVGPFIGPNMNLPGLEAPPQ